MRSVYDNIAVGGLSAQYNTISGVISNGASVDTKGYNTAAIRVFTTATAAATAATPAMVSTLAVVLQESSDNSTFTTATDVSGATIGGTITATTSAVIASFRVEGLGQNRLRYLRVRTTPTISTTTPNFVFTSVAVVELGRGYIRPSMSGTTAIVVSNT